MCTQKIKPLPHPNIGYRGVLQCPPSKSYMQRATAIALLVNGKTRINNPCFCSDTEAVLEVARNMGADVEVSKKEVSITPGQPWRKKTLDVGESGLGIRMLTPLVALHSEKLTLTGRGSLTGRPMHGLEAPLSRLGVTIRTHNGFLPIHVQGPLQGGHVSVDGSISSQIVTGLLIALPKTSTSSRLTVMNLQSKPYIDMTLEIMKHFGVKVTHEHYKTFYIDGGQTYKAAAYTVEGDWSGAAFHLVGGAIAGDVTVRGLNPASKQADINIIEALKRAGAKVTVDDSSIRVVKDRLTAFHVDATDCPDLFPPLSNLAAACKGTSVIKGVGRLLHKESNRAAALQEIWTMLGIGVRLKDDEMHITGGRVKGGEIPSNNDHRIAMMGGIANLVATTPIRILQPEAVKKSYPAFFEDYNTLIHTNT